MRIARDSLYTFLGSSLPALLAIPTLGYLSRNIEIEAFGIYLMFYVLLGYSNLFELGLGKSLIREIAKLKDYPDKVNLVLTTGGTLLLILGVVSNICLFLLSPRIVDFLNVSSHYSDDTVTALKILSFSIPLTFSSLTYTCYLEGIASFLKLSVLNLLNGTISIIMILLATMLKPDLITLAIAMIAGRLISSLFLLYISSSLISSISYGFSKIICKNILAFGGWFSISTIVAPVVVHFDRLIVSNMLGGNIFSFYVSFSESISRLSIIPDSVSRVIFSNLTYRKDRSVYNYGLIFLSIIMTILTSALFLFGEELLSLWLGKEIPKDLLLVFYILVIGFIFNSYARLPFSKILASGKSRMVAILHILEMMPYLFILYTCTAKFGAMGAAFSWSLRCAIDCIALFVLNRKVK